MKRAGRKQASFTSGELAPSVWERDDYKFFWSGLRRAENVDVTPQGGLTLRPGLRWRASLPNSAGRLFAFTASNGVAYDIVASAGLFRIFGGPVHLASVPHPFDGAQLIDLGVAQKLDVGLFLHKDVRTQRLIHRGPSDWTLEPAPLTGLPRYDYGGDYDNGVPAVWELEFIGFDESSDDDPVYADIVFVLMINAQETQSIRLVMETPEVEGSTVVDHEATAARIEAALLDLPNVSPGLTVAWLGDEPGDLRYGVTFAGAGNIGDGWAVSGRVVNRADAAILATKATPGQAPGEPIMSDTVGWPRCACFHQQRLFLGGLRSLPNTYLVSRSGFVWDFDERLDAANGPFTVPMDTPGGEAIEHIIAGRNLLILTSNAEYWIADRAISKTSPPVHVEASRNGSRRVPPAENEGAVLFAFRHGGGIGEFRYTDVDGNYQTGDIGLLAPHLVRDLADLAVRRKTGSQAGNRLALIDDNLGLTIASVLRDQDVTAFVRVASDGGFMATSCNGANELLTIARRPVGGSFARSLEVFEDGLLLDSAVDREPVGQVVGDLALHEGAEVWAIADGNVFGPFTVVAGSITLPVPAASVTVGRWRPPVIRTLPLTREVGPKIVSLSRGRIHSVHLELEDTTSVAIAVGDRPAQDIDLVPLDGLVDGTPELSRGFSGRRTIRGLTGYVDDPFVTITQVRPGRLTLKAIVVEAAL